MRAVGYTRVSSEEQLEGYSLEAQAEAIRQLCATRGWTLAGIYEERGRSGKSALRPEFQTMIRNAEAGAFDVIVCHKLDRFSRSLLDVLQYLSRLHKADVAFVSASEDFDFSTPFGRLILAVLGAFAQWYVDNLAAEVRKGKKQRAYSGGWNGTLNFGYTTPGRMRRMLIQLGEDYKAGRSALAEYERKTGLLEDGLERYGHLPDTHAVPCPLNSPGAIMAFTLYATGRYSHMQVAWELNKAGYRTTGRNGSNPFSRTTVKAMLSKRFYLGETEYRGERLEGNHEPLISQEIFDECQRVATRRNNAQYSNTSAGRNHVRPYPLTGLLRCVECGLPWRGQWRGNGRSYRDPSRDMGRECGQRPRSIKAEWLEDQVSQTLTDLRLRLPDDWQERALQYMLEQQAPPDEEQEKLRAALEQRLTRAKGLYLLGDLDEAGYRAIRSEVHAQMPRETIHQTDIEVVMETAARLLENMSDLLKKATPEEIKEVYRALITTLYVQGGTIVALEPTNVLWQILNCGTLENNSPDVIPI